jgi:hypothetical protein
MIQSMYCRTIGEVIAAVRSELPNSIVWTGDRQTSRNRHLSVSFSVCLPTAVDRFYEHYQVADNVNDHAKYFPTAEGWELDLSRFSMRVTQNTTPWEPMTPKQFLGFVSVYSQTGNNTKDSEIEMQ